MSVARETLRWIDREKGSLDPEGISNPGVWL
jgi:hypothetical protein